MSQFNQRRDGWTAEIQAELDRLVAAGAGSSQIAAALNCSRNAVIGRVSRVRMNLGKGKPMPYAAEQLALLRHLWTETIEPAADIIVKVNAAGARQSSHQQLRDVARAHGWRRPEGWKRANGKRVAQMQRERKRKSAYTKFSATNPPIAIPLREVHRLAAEIELPLSQRDDIHALNRAVRQEQPNHPGFILADYQPTRLTWAR